MCTYLKNMEGYKLKYLKLKEFDSIQEMFDRAFKRVNTFKDFRTELVEGKEKRAGTELIQEITKKQKVEDDIETAKLKQLMEIIPDEEEVAIDAIPLAVKSPTILVKAKYESTRPVEGLDLLLWGDLKTMFEPYVEDEIYMLVEKSLRSKEVFGSILLVLMKKLDDFEEEYQLDLVKTAQRLRLLEVNAAEKLQFNAPVYHSAATYFGGVTDWYLEPSNMTTPHPTPFPTTTPRAGVLIPFVIISNSDDEITTLPVRPAPPSSDHIPALFGYPLDSGDNSSDEDLSETAESLHTQTAST
ncbi:hypothetical protein Tco_0988516 [Tanacetum coccineum]|uniref:Uncharacterized protein n=1 Tax=Tanacetum coccineum TaxID=301880 RepID=A0ABQ5ERC8_9ASTR